MATHLSSRPGSPWLWGWSWLFSHGNHTLCPGMDNPALALSGPQRRAPQGRPRFTDCHKDPNAVAAPHSRLAVLNTHPYTQICMLAHKCTHTHWHTLISNPQFQQQGPESLKLSAFPNAQTHASQSPYTPIVCISNKQQYILMHLQLLFVSWHYINWATLLWKTFTFQVKMDSHQNSLSFPPLAVFHCL